MLSLLFFTALQSADADWPDLDQFSDLVREHEVADVHSELEAALDRWIGGTRPEVLTQRVQGMFEDTWSAPQVALEWTDRLFAAVDAQPADLDSLLIESMSALDIAPTDALDNDELLDPGLGIELRLDLMIDRLLEASDFVEQAFAAFTGQERAQLRGDLERLTGRFVETVYPMQEPAYVEMWRRLERIDAARLQQAGQCLTVFAEPRLHALLKRETRRMPAKLRAPRRVPGVDGRLRFARETPIGWVIIGSSLANEYDLPVALLIDLGGKDIYHATATRSDVDTPISVVLDLAGDDRYTANEPFAQGCGLLGASLLVDVDGDDVYQAGRYAHGCGIGGLGILLDHEGDDQYSGDAYCLGAGAFGVGLLLDLAGNDTMTAGIDSLGFGLTRGLGLAIDVEGDDQRTVTGQYPSSYGTAGQFSGHALGAGFGMRSLQAGAQVSGGFGICLDGDGDDHSRVGEYSCGAGYFFGCGIYRDRGGDDRIDASRYGIATGAHYGIGIVLEDGGNDIYHNPYTASIAGNWDLHLAYFVDAQGDDHYQGAGITTGSSTITSLSLFVDGDGVDQYGSGGALCYGACGHATDVARGTRSFALFLDAGGQDDQYAAASLAPAPGNDSANIYRRQDQHEGKTAESGVGLFIDR